MGSATITFPMFGEGFSLDFSNHFTLFGHNFYWYGVIIAVGFLLAVAYAMKRAKSFGLTSDNIIDMLLCAVPSAIICARLYYVIFNFSLYKNDPWEILKIWNGGLAIYGGIIGAVLAVVIYCKVKKIPAGAMLDVGGLGLMIGQAIGRWGNFTNREAYGSVTDIFCKMGLTTSQGTIYVHPTFLYESLWNFIGFIFLHFWSKKHRRYDGQVFTMYIAWYGLGRFFIEGLRTDSLYIPETSIRVSQLLAALTFILAVCLFVHKIRRKDWTPGMLYVNREPEMANDTTTVCTSIDSEAIVDMVDTDMVEKNTSEEILTEPDEDDAKADTDVQ